MTSLSRVFALSLLALVVGCTSIGVPVAETTSEKVVFAYKAVATGADTVGILFDGGQIDREEARAAHTRLSEAKRGIDLAVELRDAGDFSQAETRLAAIISALQILQGELDAKRSSQ